MQTITPEWLQALPALQEVPTDQLQWLIDHSRHYILAEGDYLFRSNEPITGMHLVVSGRIHLFLPGKNGVREITYLEAGDISGYLPFSRGFVANGSGQVVDEAQLMTLPIEKTKELITGHFELTQSLVHVMTTRVRDFTALQQQNEKMLALGKLSAGLAHELNNPAAAIVRGSTSLKKHLQLQPETFKKVIAIRMSEAEVDAVNNKMFEVLNRKDKPLLTMMQKKQREDSLIDCLEEKNVDNVEDIAENFVEFGFTEDDMQAFMGLVPPTYLSPVLNWINNNLVTEKMVNDIHEASQRISTLISAVKNFTHMDKGQEKEYTDIHAGIRSTLTMLQHKIRKESIELVEDFDTGLPPVKAAVGALNQVWTNLIDNALDAMEAVPNGILLVKTQHDKTFVKVTVQDNGTGIPEDLQATIFDPFYTTKEVGKGTGLGLDVVKRIVQQHRGSIKVHSVPGQTAFVVCFPIDG